VFELVLEALDLGAKFIDHSIVLLVGWETKRKTKVIVQTLFQR
jgi:hypothetical protein